MNEKDYQKQIAEINNITEEDNEPTTELTPNPEETPDLESFINSQEYTRLGKESHIPLKVTVRGQSTTVYIRPLTSQEWHNIRLRSISNRDNPDLVACEMVCTNKEGKPYKALTLEQLDAGVIDIIGASIKKISGIETEEYDLSEVLENFLND